MSLSDRRNVLLSGLAFAGLVGCGFAPAYGPTGGAAGLQGNIGANAPRTRAGYLLLQRIEERLGRNDNGALILSTDLDIRRSGVGVTSDDETARVQLFGTADWRVQRAIDGVQVGAGRVQNFTAFSTTGSTVATQAAERDARERLMIILADAIVDELILDAPRLLDAS